jgi:hypothetical protein
MIGPEAIPVPPRKGPKAAMTFAIDPEALYLQLGYLVSTMPDLAGPGPITPEINQWLGRVTVLVEASGDLQDLIALQVSSEGLDSVLRRENAQIIAAVVHRALARAELRAPTSARGGFIPVGEAFTAFAAVGRILEAAQRDVLMVDPYANAKILADYAILAPEGVNVRVLTDAGAAKADLKPAAEHWLKQFGLARPLEVRLAGARTLHDRVIAVDGTDAWSLTQSLKDFAVRSPATILRVDAETARMKIEAYTAIWQASSPV